LPDLVIRGGTLVEPTGPRRADVRIDGGLITDIAAEIAVRGGGADDIDACGLTLFPGVVDGHVHFNEPGRTEWEGASTGSRALAAGGGTTFIDMPLNSTPCTVTATDVELKRIALEKVSIADFGLWGGLVPGHVGDLPEMAAQGVVGFKAFMCDSGLPEFPRADDTTLRDGMIHARALGLPIAVHAERDDLVTAMTGTTAREFLASRPVAAELDAIGRVLTIAEETGAAVHIVHVSSGRGVALAAAARDRGVDVSIETCPHYLTFTDADLERLGVIGKCAPPLRSAADQKELWRTVFDGTVDIVGSDHSPAPPEMKIADDFKTSWGGIAGIQSTLATLLTGGTPDRTLPLERVAALVAAAPARRFRMAHKGRIAIGHDADVVLVDLGATQTLTAGALLQRHPFSPYAGRSFRGVVRRTIRRGETIFRDGTITASRGGHFVRPA
jgi:allantoinase